MQTVQLEPLVITRVLSAPKDKVFRAWIDPSMIAKWFLPNERWAKCESEIQPEVDGRYRIKLTHSDGDQFTMGGKIVELVPNEKLAFTWGSDGDPEDVKASLVTVTLRSVDNGTELVLAHSQFKDENEKNQVGAGWPGCLDNLDSYLQA